MKTHHFRLLKGCYNIEPRPPGGRWVQSTPRNAIDCNRSCAMRIRIISPIQLKGYRAIDPKIWRVGQTLLYKAILMCEHKADLPESFIYKRFRDEAIANSWTSWKTYEKPTKNHHFRLLKRCYIKAKCIENPPKKKHIPMGGWGWVTGLHPVISCESGEPSKNPFAFIHRHRPRGRLQ